MPTPDGEELMMESTATAKHDPNGAEGNRTPVRDGDRSHLRLRFNVSQQWTFKRSAGKAEALRANYLALVTPPELTAPQLTLPRHTLTTLQRRAAERP